MLDRLPPPLSFQVCGGGKRERAAGRSTSEFGWRLN